MSKEVVLAWNVRISSILTLVVIVRVIFMNYVNHAGLSDYIDETTQCHI